MNTVGCNMAMNVIGIGMNGCNVLVFFHSKFDERLPDTVKNLVMCRVIRHWP
ncbi:hypothetical protein LTSEINV_6502 [Salmonella enterica subsp. enterica serovar Inverness str. R8-3668]|uniref:Uncharacterized protein n=3 Tax=Salmonella enterica I TaxID=59201 RepID=G5S5A9_SALET|nr:hypothetical protein LTSEINV_6502 [Salmonella enterica subsp. enterica serovar Inverness str. R8-3668]EHC86945.1 hypothetical protein LTSERUB_3298 [Salmonella enterica subsp. enterica serovar Rubislaw str. A4-653]EHC96077.1 hypothetical protein LTSEURB_6690 [Salmonella enterica subsp. enterica serovar Urbana str. R8-2977]